MTLKDQPRFFQALNAMGEFFSDELTEIRQRIYWDLFQRVSIDAWEYACVQCMRSETFHKVPLPAVLTPHVMEYQRREMAQREALANDQERRLLETEYIQKQEHMFLEAESQRLRAIIAQQKAQEYDDAN